MRVILILLLMICITAQTVLSIERTLKEPPALPVEQAIIINKFWSSIKKRDFDTAIKSAKEYGELHSNHDYEIILGCIVDLIKRYRKVVAPEFLSDFLLLEKKRLYWQEYNWWPETESYNEAVEQVNTLLEDYIVLSERSKDTELEAEVLYRIGLIYSFEGQLGFEDYNYSIEYFKKVIEKYPQNYLTDEAFFRIILIKAKVTEETENNNIDKLLNEFISNYPTSNRITEARSLLASHYKSHKKYRLAENEYWKAFETTGNTKEGLGILWSLEALYFHYLKNRNMRIYVLEKIIKDFPNTSDASKAEFRLRHLKRLPDSGN